MTSIKVNYKVASKSLILNSKYAKHRYSIMKVPQCEWQKSMSAVLANKGLQNACFYPRDVVQ